MALTFDKYKNHLYNLTNNRSLVVSLLLTCILSYGFTITNFSIGIDDTAFYRYFEKSDLLAQGRFGSTFLHEIFNMFEFAPFWLDTLAVSILFIAALTWCTLFIEITKGKLNNTSYIIFTTLFVSYPIINEIFIYMIASVPVCLGYLLTAIALIFSYEWIINKSSSIHMTVSMLIMTFTISMSEAFAPVFICGMFIILILVGIYSDENKFDLKQYFKFFVKFILILTVSILLEFIISKIIIILLNIEVSPRGATDIFWFNGEGILNNLKLLIFRIYYSYLFKALEIKAILIFDLACLITAILGVIFLIKKKSITFFLLFLGLGLSNISLSVMQGTVSPYRTCMTFALFVGFVFMILYNQISNTSFKKILSLFVFIIVVIQSKNLNQRFYNDYKRYCQDKQVAIQTATIINYEFDNSKPIVFLGGLGAYPNIEVGQTNGLSVINWGVLAFRENSTELLNFMMMHGYAFNQATDEQVEDAKKKSADMAVYPKKGYIKEFEDYIAVKFGE